ncbi:MAG TPA: alpha/beta hydrolase [Polyangiaceae bacterium]|nr:alpha/beta hydrolase [Polyangiaceae bacterium]
MDAGAGADFVGDAIGRMVLCSTMRVPANGIELEYESFGRADDPAMVLIMGFAEQLLGYDADFCERLAAEGFRVIRFDNRDVGLSTHLDAATRPKIPAILAGDTSTVAYSIDDMAEDTAGLIRTLGPAPAHLVGVSMGGMIAQSLATRHPAIVRSLTSIMSTTGARNVGQPGAALPLLMRRPPTERAAFVEHGLETWRALGSPGFPFDEARARARVGAAFDRSFYPPGAARQLAAILSQRDRTLDLGRLRIPATVIHGVDDPLVQVSGGEATARAIPGANLILIPGMGHDLPEALWPRLIGAIVETARRGETSSS